MARGRGRPPKYRKEFADKLLQFFEAHSEPEFHQAGDKVVNVPPRFPTLARFAVQIGVTRETLWDWATKRHEGGDRDGELVYPEFSHAYNMAKAYQEAILAENGLTGGYNGSFANIVAKNLIDWRDPRDVNVAGQTGGAPIQFEVVGVPAKGGDEG